ncbi:MAG TPA: 50S ribosomal protein L29 [candidate division Zixibacteria bacterium]|jgi:large subunit ribosomal protein L29
MEHLKSDRLREMSEEELGRQLRDVQEEIFNLRIRRSLQPPDNPLVLRHLRRQIARIKTVMNEAKRGIVTSGKQKA